MEGRVLVLTAAGGVPDALVARVPGGRIRLGDNAVEITLDRPVSDELRARARDVSVDANVLSIAGRRKRLLIADMDSTIIAVECIDELADFAGVKPEVAAITEAAMRGELDFEAALLARVALLAGLPETALHECYAARVRLNPGALTLVRTMAGLGALTALVSGGFSYFTERVAAATGFARHQANVLEISNGRLTGEVSRPILGRAAKLVALRAAVRDLGVTNADVLAVGDGANDLDMIEAAGLGVAYRAKPALVERAAACLEHSDLTALLVLQGIPERDWRI